MSFDVFVDDNFHYADEDERDKLGSFPTAEAAVEAARRIVDEYLNSNLRPGMTAEQLYFSYTSFGEDPFIVGDGVTFSAWDYAKQRCHELCNTGASCGTTEIERPKGD